MLLLGMGLDAYVQVPKLLDLQELFNKILNSDVKLERLAQVPGLYSWMDLVMALSDTESVLEKDELAHLKETNNLLIRYLPGLVQKGFIRQTLRPWGIEGEVEYACYFELTGIPKLSEHDIMVWDDYRIEENEIDCLALTHLLRLVPDRNYGLAKMYQKVSNVGISINLFCGVFMLELCKKGFLNVIVDNSGENEPEIRYQLANIG